MKKTICVFMCFFIALCIGVPVINSASKYMRAADVYEGEKVIDFEFAQYGYPKRENNIVGGTFSKIYAITEDNNLFCRKKEDDVTDWTLLMDENGSPLQQVIQITAAENDQIDEFIALRNDGQLYVSGVNDGKFGNGESTNEIYSNAKLVNPGVSNIKTIKIGYKTSYLLTENGDVYASGDNSNGQIGDNTNNNTNVFVKVSIDNVKQIAVGGRNTVFALKDDGSVWAWGEHIFDGKNVFTNITEPKKMVVLDEQGKNLFDNIVAIDAKTGSNGKAILGAVVKNDDTKTVTSYLLGDLFGYGTDYFYGVSGIFNKNAITNLSSISYGSQAGGATSYVDAVYFTTDDGIPSMVRFLDNNPVIYYDFPGNDNTEATKINKIRVINGIVSMLNNNGELYTDLYKRIYDLEAKKEIIRFPLSITALKKDNSNYESEEKYNDSIIMNVISSQELPVTCQVENPVGGAVNNCTDFKDNSIAIDLQSDRIYRKYIFENDYLKTEFTVDLYKAPPQLQGYSSTSINKIKKTDSISLAVPNDQTDWNSYSATITDSANQTSNFTGGTLNAGTYTMTVMDAYGNTQDYQFEVSDKPEPTSVFTPSSSSLVYKDAYTKVNGTVGTFSLQYPVGEPTSTIASIQLGTSGDESYFSIDTSGSLKVKGSDLNAGTYNVTVSGKDGNQMDFTKTVQIVVSKANQDNYQITNNANYNFQSNQEINITTSGNESGESETYTITNGNSIAQISNTNKFKMISAGSFTLEATVAGNVNYNPKTVTKQITLSQLPTQTNPIKISSGDSMVYGNSYTPTYTGGTGSGNVSWSIENDSGTGASLNNGSIKVTGVGTFTLKVTKAGDTNYQSSSDSKVITVNPRKTTVKPKDVTRKVGEAFKDNGVTYNPQPIAGDNLGTPIITSKYPISQQAGRYTDGIQVTGLTNPNYDFEYQEGTLIINDTTLPNNGSGYYKITGTKGKNNWYVSDIQISTTNKDGYDEISSDGINFQTSPIIYHTDGDYPVTFYLKNSTTGIIAKGINYQVKIDQTPPTVPTLTMNEINASRMARLINFLSFGNWMNKSAEVVMSSTDGTSGIDNYTYIETDTKGTSNTKTSTTGKVTYKNDVEIGITAKACDKAGNCSDVSSSETLMIDRKAPDITGVKDQSVYKYYYLPRFINVKDNGSGLSYAEYLKDGTQAGTIQEGIDERIDGVGQYEVNAIDNAGNETNISFEIVPLPSIDDIDGSDESKDIIDQVINELDEIKDKIDKTEKEDYEQWIKDALDKWESERKKVVETDDKTSKVEGVGDTTFDPNLELIVDDITNQPLPLLPKNANAVYDVYLQKGNTKVEPDGSIKVYLPYTDQEEPIIYQIDTNGKVIEIKAEKEGNYVTFITNELGKFAISNTAQPDNKDNMCVVGPDGKIESGDEVCGKPNDKGDQPTKKPDGSVEVPDGGKVEFPNGKEIETPDGAIINPDGSVTLPDGTEYDPDGNIKDDKKVCELDDKDINIDTDGDGLPDLNLDIDHDCIADLNIDTNFDNIPDINIDTKGDGKPDINVDTDGDGKANINIAVVKRWLPNKNCNYNGFAYDTGEGFTPILNIDEDGDGNPDRNIDDDGDGIPDRNIDSNWFDKYGNLTRDLNANIGGANTGDASDWSLWWVLFICTGSILLISRIMKRYYQ